MIGLGLALAATMERLDRIEEALGLTDMTPMQAEYEAWSDEMEARGEGGTS